MPVRSRTLPRVIRAVVFTLAVFPMLGASDCADLLGTDSESSENYDGAYELVSVNGRSMPYTLTYVDAENKHILTRGRWTIDGRTLTTEMWSTFVISGQTTKDPRFNPERHTGTITMDGDRVTATLEDGRWVTGSIHDGTLVTDDAGNTLEFRK